MTEWNYISYNISYKPLKKLINKVARVQLQPGMLLADDDNIIGFLFTLDQELQKVNAVLMKKRAELEERLEKYRYFYNTNGSEDTSNGIVDSVLDLEELQSALIETKNNILKLLNYADMNMKGFNKILKKFDKTLGKEAKEPYLNTKELDTKILSEMSDSIEKWLCDVSARIKAGQLSDSKFLTEEQNNVLIHYVEKDDVNALQGLINGLINKNSNNKVITQTHIKKMLTSILLKASYYRAFRCIKSLLKIAPNIIIMDDINGRTLIHKLSIFGGSLPPGKTSFSNVEDSTILVLENLDHSVTSKVSTPDVFGRHPLHYSAANGMARITTVLIDHLISNGQISGFDDPLWCDSDGYTPLLYAVSRGHTKIVDSILCRLKNVISITSIVNPHHTEAPLMVACKLGHYETAKLLLSYGADPNTQNEAGETSLHFAAKNGYLDCVKVLIGLDNDPSPYECETSFIKKTWRANIEIKDKFYGWTPLFLASNEGHVEIVEVLLQVGAKKNLVDFFEFTPYMHAVFRGHFVDPLKPALHELELKPTLSSFSNKEACHKYLQEDQSLIIIKFGTSDARKSVVPVQLDTSVKHSSLSIRANEGKPKIINLPLKDIMDPIHFFLSNVDNIITITFDLVPTFGIKKQLLGRATALISSGLYHTSLTNSVSVPIIGTDLNILGRIVFEWSVIKSYKHQNYLSIGKQLFWSSLTKIIGHRGMGANSENTVMSFITAASLGAEYVEMDVQLTKDHIPVIYHDWMCSETGYGIPINSITLEQFRKIRENNLNDADREIRRSKNEQTKDGIWKGTMQAPFATLEEAFKKLPPSIGFNVEIKYPMVDEAQEHSLPPFFTELNIFVDTILNCVFCHAGERDIIFSSFSPDICLMLSWKQRAYPVFFLTDCGIVKMADERCNSIRKAIRFAQFARLLGIVTNAEPIIKAPGLVKIIKDSGLMLFTYGPLNNSIQNVQLQRRAGVDAVIVDSVLAVRRGI
ncbi:hypothetical protein Glove_393g44 [Diversispora epigaea]|uniref:GP-PDE domain-containing protein n=1 Tax=Diversispora epigaea TaxID=1348612 RepID=A0A397H628_9GLOM|nr:hypothetical protein Glove_393g44 [Diversispora epigaea]